MDPAQGVVGDTELTRIVRNDHRVAEQAVMADGAPDRRLRNRTQKLSVEDIDVLAGQMLEERDLIGETAGGSVLSLAMIACSTPCAFSQFIASSLRT